MRDDIVEEPPWSVYDEDPLTQLLDRQNGVISRHQALTHLSEKALRHRIASGRWRRVHRAVFVTYAGPLTDAQRRWIAVLAAVRTLEGAFLAGVTALQVYGLRGINSSRVHVAVPHDRRVSAPAFVVVHRSRDLSDDDRHPGYQPALTLPGRSVVDAAQWARSDAEARLMIAASVQQRIVAEREVVQDLGYRLDVRRRQLILRTVHDSASGSHSLGELDFLQICRRGGLPIPNRQMRRQDTSGRTRYIDACFDDYRVAVEIDGAHHVDVGQMWDDHVRQNDLSLAGYVILRYPVFVIREQPERVVSEVQTALRARGWRQ
jgi:very-short-patch-repair endonuclease